MLRSIMFVAMFVSALYCPVSEDEHAARYSLIMDSTKHSCRNISLHEGNHFHQLADACLTPQNIRLQYCGPLKLNNGLSIKRSAISDSVLWEISDAAQILNDDPAWMTIALSPVRQFEEDVEITVCNRKLFMRYLNGSMRDNVTAIVFKGGRSAESILREIVTFAESDDEIARQLRSECDAVKQSK